MSTQIEALLDEFLSTTPSRINITAEQAAKRYSNRDLARGRDN